jgi:signal transduction histidine kinase
MFRHIRSKLVAAFAVPLIVLLAVASLEISSTASQMNSIDREASLARASVGPGGTVGALQNERADAVMSILENVKTGLPTVLQGLTPAKADLTLPGVQIRAQTDNAIAEFKADVKQAGPAAEVTYQGAFASVPSLLDSARQEWETAGNNTSSDFRHLATDIYYRYSAVISQFINASAGVPFEISDPTLRTGVEALMASMQKTEADWRVTMDLFEAAWARKSTVSTEIYQATQDFGGEYAYVQRLNNLATGPFKTAVNFLVGSALDESLEADIYLMQQGSTAPLNALMEAFDQSPPGPSGRTGSQTYIQVGNSGIAAVVNQRADVLHSNALNEMEQYGVAGAAGAVLGLLLVALVSRSISKPLVDLAHQAGELASSTLPATVQAILDAATTGAEPPPTPKVRVTSRDEVAGMGTALEAVKKTAIELAVGQAALRRNLADAFVNLGRRNQNLVTRQLEYISEIELKEADPESLEELFRLDHLATRMRRNAESLLILAGTGPARQWSAAAPAMDIARAASAEVEDYKRLRLHHFDPAMVTGAVTTDLVHIMAELIENALSFSPPGSPVDVYGRFLEGGYVVVIVDSGIGMAAEDLQIANHRLEGHGAEGEVPGRYLGHFVAGRLSSRHGIAISLQSSHSGGLVARVKIPAALIEDPVPDLSAIAEVSPVPAPPGPEPSADLMSTQPVTIVPSAKSRPDATPAPVVDRSGPPTEAGTTAPPGAAKPGTDQTAGRGPSDRGPAPDRMVPAVQDDYQPPVGGGAGSGYGGPAPDWSASNWPGGEWASGAGTHEGTDEDMALRGATGQGDTDEDQTNQLTWDKASAEAGIASDAPAYADYAEPQYGEAQYGEAQYGEPQYGEPQYGEPQYGEPQYGEAQYGHPEYAHPEHAEYGAREAQSTQGPDGAGAAWGTDEPTTEEHWDPMVATASATAAPAPAQPPAPPMYGDTGLATPPAGMPDLGLLLPHASTLSARFQQPATGTGSNAPGGGASAAAWNSLPSPTGAPAIGPAAQARTTAEGLRKLTRRVPGASLPEEDDRLRRATPTSTTRNPLGLTGALSQYLSATNKAGQPQKEQNSR